MQASFSEQERFATIRPSGRCNTYANKLIRHACRMRHACQNVKESP
ncbi:MAG: hypothetical protein ABFE02_05120 [Sulfuricella sp.]